MKNNKFILLSLVSLLMIIILTGCSNTESKQNNQSEYEIDQSDFVKGADLIKDISKSELNEQEISGLILMREEEKLARDVYITLGEKWDMNIFSNISESEQTHTNAIKTLLDRYELKDPVMTDKIGVFTSDELSNLYNKLIGQGEKSLVDALIVGATVEDLDIYDLNNLSDHTDNTDILIVYENLNRGSRNHMRAFVKQIKRNGGDYSPQYISQSDFDEIISSDQERGENKSSGRKGRMR